MLNFYDTEAVKAFTLKILVENRELSESLDFERSMSNDWFKRFKEAEKKAVALEAELTALKGDSENE